MGRHFYDLREWRIDTLAVAIRYHYDCYYNLLLNFVGNSTSKSAPTFCASIHWKCEFDCGHSENFLMDHFMRKYIIITINFISEFTFTSAPSSSAINGWLDFKCNSIDSKCRDSTTMKIHFWKKKKKIHLALLRFGSTIEIIRVFFRIHSSVPFPIPRESSTHQNASQPLCCRVRSMPVGTCMIIQPVNHVSLQLLKWPSYTCRTILWLGPAPTAPIRSNSWSNMKGCRPVAIGLTTMYRPAKRRTRMKREGDRKMKKLTVLINLSLKWWPFGENVDFRDALAHVLTAHWRWIAFGMCLCACVRSSNDFRLFAVGQSSFVPHSMCCGTIGRTLCVCVRLPF